MVIFSFLLVFSGYLNAQKYQKPGQFRFIFMTDIHVQPERSATDGFIQAIDTINSLRPDFVLTGGDLIMDALGQRFSRADSLYQIYLRCQKKIQAPVYNTFGNHEMFALYRKAGADTSNPLAGRALYEKYLGNSYYSFQHRGWKFLVLNSVQATPARAYEGGIDAEQMDWIREELRQTDTLTPICISVHIPMMTVFAQVTEGATSPNSPGVVITNAREVLSLFEGYNLKLVLQGHLHYLEDISVQGVRFITGGSVASGWWKKVNMGVPYGFLVLEVDGESVNWHYQTYGWTAR